MENFFARLEARARERGTLLCVGLDPHPEDLPTLSAQAAQAFCLRLIEATAPYALAFKPNAAFFEIYGAAGWEALRQVIAAAQATGAPIILDAKRGDIASTARAYAQAAFHGLGADALTVNPYLGRDAVAPFVEDPTRGVFLLCKTSNPGSADLQDVTVAEEGGQPLFLRVARLAQRWNEHGNVGLVVGATHPAALRQVREAAPDLWFLAPGVGAQGGDLVQALEAGLRADGSGLLIAVSRGISRAADPAAAAQRLAAATAAPLQQGAVRATPPPFHPPSPLPSGKKEGGKEGGEERVSPLSAPRQGRSPEGQTTTLPTWERRGEQGGEERTTPAPEEYNTSRPASPAQQARALRRRMTEAERLLWQHLRAKQLGIRFRRQHPVGPYILDFYAPQARLAVEIDGGGHNEPAQHAHDEKRTRFLEEQGIQVLRFWNHEVLQHTQEVLTAIWEALQQRKAEEPLTPPPFNPPSPLPGGERGGGKEGGEERVGPLSVPRQGRSPEGQTTTLPTWERRGEQGGEERVGPPSIHGQEESPEEKPKKATPEEGAPHAHINQGPDTRTAVARALVTTGCVRFGTFTLKSGLQSPIYIDLRLLASFPDLLAQVAALYAPLLEDLTFDRLAALPYAALPIGTAVALHTGAPLIYPRKEVKAYGTRAAIEGVYHPGERAVLLDVLATTGGSKIEAAAKLRAAGLEAQDVVVLIDRQSGAREELAAQGLHLHAVFTLTELLDLWETEGLVSPERLAEVRRWLEAERG